MAEFLSPLGEATLLGATVRESDGIVAVYSGVSGELITAIDYPVAGLPRADRDLLSDGIAVESDDELAMLLEDYQG